MSRACDIEKRLHLCEYKWTITSNITGISFAGEAIDIYGDRHLRVSYVDRISWILIRRYERYSMRGHSLVHQQKVVVVLPSWLTIHTVAGVTLVADAGELIFAGRHACRVRRAQMRVVSARGMRKARETVAVVTLKATGLRSSVYLHSGRARVIARCFIVRDKRIKTTFSFSWFYKIFMRLIFFCWMNI